MAIKRSVKLVVRELPEKFTDAQSETKETWSAKRLSGDRTRATYEMMAQQRWEMASSYFMVQAWMTFAGSTITWIDEDTGETGFVFPQKPIVSIAEFTEGWDSLPFEMQTWIIENVVWKANPQFDTSGVSRKDVDDKDADGKKKQN